MLSEADKTKIEHHISALRDRIAQSDLDEPKKKILNRKLDELVSALTGKRINFTKTMVIIASIFTAISQAEGTLVKLPDSIAAISRVIGEISDFEQKLLQAPEQRRLEKSNQSEEL